MRKGWILAFLLLFIWCCARVMPLLSCECVGCAKGEECLPSGMLGSLPVCDCLVRERAPEVVLWAFPMKALSPARICLTLELKGSAPLPLEWRCPKITWRWPDELTKSAEEADCAPREMPTRVWRKCTPGRVDLKAESAQEVPFTAEISYNGKVLATKTVMVEIMP